MYYDAAREELEIEFNARYDYVREAYGDLAEDPATLRYEAEADEDDWRAEIGVPVGPLRPYVSGDIDF